MYLVKLIFYNESKICRFFVKNIYNDNLNAIKIFHYCILERIPIIKQNYVVTAFMYFVVHQINFKDIYYLNNVLSMLSA